MRSTPSRHSAPYAANYELFSSLVVNAVNDNSYGKMDPLEVALITAHAAHLSSPAEIQAAFDMPRYNAARLWRLENYGVKVMASLRRTCPCPTKFDGVIFQETPLSKARILQGQNAPYDPIQAEIYVVQ